MKKLVCLLLLSFTGFSIAVAQTNADTVRKNVLKNQPEVESREFPKKKAIKPFHSAALKDRATNQIRNLKNGVLLVRLRTSEIAIKNLKISGNEKMAATLQRQQHATNQRMIYAFEKQFTFCPVYFFLSTDTDKVKNGETSGYFLNNNLEIDNQIALADTNFFIAELTEIEQFRIDPDSPEESVNGEVTFKALVIRDDKFHQLAKPFPYFVKASSNFPPRKRSEAEMVDLMNAKLIAYYKGKQGKLKK